MLLCKVDTINRTYSKGFIVRFAQIGVYRSV